VGAELLDEDRQTDRQTDGDGHGGANRRSSQFYDRDNKYVAVSCGNFQPEWPCNLLSDKLCHQDKPRTDVVLYRTCASLNDVSVAKIIVQPVVYEGNYITDMEHR